MSDDKVYGIIIDQQNRLADSIDKLNGILHANQLALTKVTDRLTSITTHQTSCGGKREENTNYLAKQKYILGGLGVLVFLVLTIVMKTIIPGMIKPEAKPQPIKQGVIPRRPYNNEEIKPIPSRAALPIFDMQKEG